MSVTLRLADDDAKVIADVLEATADIVDTNRTVPAGAVPVECRDVIPLVDKACRVPTIPGSGSEYMPYVTAAKRLRRISAAFATALKANVGAKR